MIHTSEQSENKANYTNKKRCSQNATAQETHDLGMGTPQCVLASSGVQNRLSVPGTLRHQSTSHMHLNHASGTRTRDINLISSLDAICSVGV